MRFKGREEQMRWYGLGRGRREWKLRKGMREVDRWKEGGSKGRVWENRGEVKGRGREWEDNESVCLISKTDNN